MQQATRTLEEKGTPQRRSTDELKRVQQIHDDASTNLKTAMQTAKRESEELTDAQNDLKEKTKDEERAKSNVHNAEKKLLQAIDAWVEAYIRGKKLDEFNQQVEAARQGVALSENDYNKAVTGRNSALSQVTEADQLEESRTGCRGKSKSLRSRLNGLRSSQETTRTKTKRLRSGSKPL